MDSCMESGLKCLNVIALDNKVVFVLNIYFLIYFKKNIEQQFLSWIWRQFMAPLCDCKTLV